MSPSGDGIILMDGDLHSEESSSDYLEEGKKWNLFTADHAQLLPPSSPLKELIFIYIYSRKNPSII